MIRSFKRRIESLFKINEDQTKKQAITILNYNLRDNCNSYLLQEDGTYIKKESVDNYFDIFKEFYNMNSERVEESIIL